MCNIILRGLWCGWKIVKAPNADGDFSKSPYFNFNDDKLKFNTNDVSNANDNYGSVSGFVPKYQLSTKGILKDTFCFVTLVITFEILSNHQACDRFHQ